MPTLDPSIPTASAPYEDRESTRRLDTVGVGTVLEAMRDQKARRSSAQLKAAIPPHLEETPDAFVKAR